MAPPKARLIKVQFFGVQPSLDEPHFVAGAFPLETVKACVLALDPAADDYRIESDLFGSGVLCLWHEDGPVALLGAYYKDMFSMPLTEYKGEIARLLLREGEGLVDASFAAFLPHDVVGLVRTSPKAPGHARIAKWLSAKGGIEMWLVPLRDPGVVARIKGGVRFGSLRLKVRLDTIGDVEKRHADVAKALRDAATLTRATKEVGIEISPGHGDTGSWTPEVEDLLAQLGDLLPSFLVAELTLPSGGGRPSTTVNLRQGLTSVEVPAELNEAGRLGPLEAARAIHRAYLDNRKGIVASAKELRS